MKNKRGFILPGLGIAVLGVQIGFGLVAAACIWHIPAWSAAKKAGCEAAYQAGDMGCGYKK